MEPQALRSQVPEKLKVQVHKCLTHHHGPEKVDLLFSGIEREGVEATGRRRGNRSPHSGHQGFSITHQATTGPCDPIHRTLPPTLRALLTLWGQTEGETRFFLAV